MLDGWSERFATATDARLVLQRLGSMLRHCSSQVPGLF